MNILLVDHTEIYRKILTQALQDYREFALFFANSGAEALELAEHADFQFVIVTQHLTDCDGVELIARFRASGRFFYEPMILLTSSPTAKLNETAQMAGVTEVFRKHDIQELVNFLRRFLSVFSTLPGRVLYIEDTNSQRAVLEAQLCEWGLHVDAFASAEDAWLAYQEHDYDLIICDIVLAGRMSGSRFVNRVRRLAGHKGDVLILALTAFDSASRRIELFHLGIDDYVAKPVIPLELRARIQNMLSRKLAADRTRVVLEATALGVIVVNEHGLIQLFNIEAEKLFGYVESEVFNRHVAELVSGLETSATQDFPAHYHALHDWQGKHRKWEASATRKNGETFPVQVTITEFAVVAGNRQLAVLVRDISDEKALSDNLRLAKEAAEAANRLKSDFLANLSHEIRTPMNAIIGFTHLTLQTELTPRQQDYLQKANQATQALLGVINDILDLSRIEAGKLEMEETPFAFRDVLNNLTALFSLKTREKNLGFALNAAPNIPKRLIGDPLRLGQVLTNLAGNAVKFTETGGVSIDAECIEESPAGVLLRFTVQDSGIGMGAAELARLFLPFSQGDGSTTRKYGGAGLGLVISKQLVEMMGGRIWVESQPGQGARFFFTARFRRAAESSAAATPHDTFASIDTAPEAHHAAAQPGDHRDGGKLDIAALKSLLGEAQTQLEEFDSGVEDTMAKMRTAVGGDAAAKAALERLNQCLAVYDYVRGLEELAVLAETISAFEEEADK
jgi:PAS domain S-box-containing protein